MNCHNNGENHQKHSGNHHIWHMLMMLLCCGLPILLLLVISVVKFSNPAIAQGLLNITPYICPIMMIAMIPMMFAGNKSKNSGSCCEHREDNNQ